MKRLAAIFLVISLLITMTSVAFGAGISQANATVDSLGNVSITGKIDEGAGKNVTLRVKNPDGDLARIDQTISTGEGSFIFQYKMINPIEGAYTVEIGGEGVDVVAETNFKYSKPTDPKDPTEPSEPTDPPGPVEPVKPTDPVKPTEPEKPIEKEESLPVTVVQEGNMAILSVSISAKKDSTTQKEEVNLKPEYITDLVRQIKDIRSDGKSVLVEIKVETLEDTKGVEVKISAESFKEIAEVSDGGIKLATSIAGITFDKKAIHTINQAAKSEDINIAIEYIEKSTLGPDVQAKIGDKPVYNFSVKAGADEISDFGGGKAEIRIPYTLKPGEKANSVVVYYIDSAGKLKTVRGNYNAKTGTVEFTVTHFSKYAIGYNEVNFKDVGNDWYNEAISYLAARGIVNGIGGEKFAPGNKVIRADFLIMVMNSYGIEVDSTIKGNFVDAGNKYYTNYLGTAKRLGLVLGAGGNMYNPEAAISREDMFVILYRVLEKLNELPEGNQGRQLNEFKDVKDIAGYAEEAMELFVKTGTVAGYADKLSPKEISTRAEAAQVLYNLLSK